MGRQPLFVYDAKTDVNNTSGVRIEMTMTSECGCKILLMLVLALPAVPVAGLQDQSGGELGKTSQLPENFSEPMPLYPLLIGNYDHPISSENTEAQAYFNQGFQLMYAFAKEDAARSFRESWRRDTSCAICYWGEAWAWGSYLNGPMGLSEAPHAYAAAVAAMDRIDLASARERAYIEAIATRYVEEFEPENRRAQDEAYAAAMRLVAETYPEDLDAATLYADALFLLEPRQGTRDLNDPNVRRLHAVLEGILARDIKHPGACHLYIHATESTVDPSKASICAEYLGDAIPGASHINHMPSHTWNEIGRWGDGVRSNIRAWHSDLKAAVGEGFAIYPSHNLHMLLFAASMDGQGAIAVQAGKDYAKLTDDSVYHVLTLIRFGRFDEVLTVTTRPTKEASGGLWDFAQGYAHLRTGNADFAKVYLDRVMSLADTTTERFRFDAAKLVLQTVGLILKGEIKRDTGDLEGAIQSFELAVNVEDDLEYSEPEPLPFPARHWLGAVLIEAELYSVAEHVYRTELDDHPNNGWSLLGLRLALEGQGKSPSNVDFDESWSRADTWITSSRF